MVGIGLFKENTKIALGAIRSQLLRTILTVMIIAIGITALVGILTVVSALENTIMKDFASMGANTFSISQYDFSERVNRNNAEQKINPIISYPQAKAFQEKYTFPFTTTSLSFTATTTAEVKYEAKKTDPEITVVGVDENFLPNKGLEATKGRNFTGFDVSNNNYVCVLGSDFEKGLFKDVNPIDKTISIRGAKFKVIGVLKEKGSTFGNNQDLRVLIPIQIARSIFSAPNINYDINVMISRKETLGQASDNATITMRKIRKLSPVQENNFGVERSDDLIQRLLSNTEVLRISAWVIGIITVFGSSIALMNIMLVSVTERTREIGVRKSLGAKRSTIAWQFFTETLVIGQMGGIVGIILGILIGFGIAKAIEFTFVIPWMAIMAAFITTFIVAIVSGLYPAIKASKLDPIEALRHE
ncbi:ABC transporter efflux protein [Flavobacterium cauense R2A-7]|uniref:Putative ABC transport system permease protein n=1 Tax=Flavobacterium cauense R2A-7 TaxID=1341154 RepID=V6S032_9FLAO|nr:ABC transporter permease [Flavobacterium cauense]ESU19637.1 ABC transporter efflux protein [Flavobacterium cauense R2A-7]KGO84157.1 ABC transporter permease [Flavobacterium cauense R2A-7]TWI14489.1 putative ABC transport system permease protein [Flavobacterium cauense R2A-7]